MTVTLQKAQADLSRLLKQLSPGEEMIITDGESPVARLIPAVHRPEDVPLLGTLRGTVLYMAPDFDAPLDDFAPYMR